MRLRRLLYRSDSGTGPPHGARPLPQAVDQDRPLFPERRLRREPLGGVQDVQVRILTATSPASIREVSTTSTSRRTSGARNLETTRPGR